VKPLDNLRWFLQTDSATLAARSPLPLTEREADAAKREIRAILAATPRRRAA
jgi:hypothetical protein